jgi:hypothetical protein
MEKWPNVVTNEFWPFAVRHACTFHSASLHSDTQQSPHRMFTGEEAPWKLEHFCGFGSPVFVLAKKLQDGDAIQKWKARSWMGVHIGHSLQHSGNVPAVYNPQTTHISPPFHVVFDDQATAVQEATSSFQDNFYYKLFNTEKWIHNDDYAEATDVHLFEESEYNPPLSNKTKSIKTTKHKQNIATHASNTIHGCHPAPPSDIVGQDIHTATLLLH